MTLHSPTLLDKFNEIFLNLMHAASECKPMEITLNCRKGNKIFDPHSLVIQPPRIKKKRTAMFPGKTAKESWRFSVKLRVLQLIHKGLVNNEKTTKRDLYYKDVKLFRSQSVVDELVDDIAFTFGVARSALNVTAATKGLIAGSLIVHRRNGAIDDCSQFPNGVLLPNVVDIERLEVNADYILVIEKEATFQYLCSEKFYSHPEIGKAILGKGYPDIATREFLRLVVDSTTLSQSAYTRSTPLYCLVDNDPHGFEIFSTYKFGSQSLAHENIHLTLPSLEWIGVFARDFDGVKNGLDGYMPLTIRDRRKAVTLLGSSWLDGELGMKSDLCRMLFVGMKAEIQAMCEANEAGLTGYLVEKIKEKREI